MSTSPHVDAHHNQNHVLATTGPHTGTLLLTDLEVGVQGEIIHRGAADWEALGVGTAGQVLISGGAGADVSWGAALSFTRVQDDTQATTNALAVVGAAIEDATDPFIVEGFLSLHNMQAGDTFLVIEEVRDEDDATYREYGRNSYAGVQESMMVHFSPKMCQGWRVRIQRTAGADRDVTYQYFLMEAGA